MISEEPLLQSSNIRYIDQQTADADGTVCFRFSELPKNTVCLLFGQTDSGSYWRYSGQIPPSFDTCTGDLNGDSMLTVADTVLLSRWLGNETEVKLQNWRAADLNGDAKLNVIDLTLMKQMITGG